MFQAVRDKAPLGVIFIIGVILLVSGVSASLPVVLASLFSPQQVILVGKKKGS